MSEPVWLIRSAVLAVHRLMIARFGGADGIRDEGLLDSALARPRNSFEYEDCDALPRLAAAYAAGIIQNHPFVDGNKRTAFITAALFLQEQGLRLIAPEAEVVVMTLGLASGEMPEPGFTAWLRDRADPVVPAR